ncbi:hypothetical protein L226DRAFT_264689 [Lentinus tigrinus ALCF2SS1-7]|nr:hypothetical protein L226DRAFT_264689 [Lentinus tigrinus ALCF2SS1-7]
MARGLTLKCIPGRELMKTYKLCALALRTLFSWPHSSFRHLSVFPTRAATRNSAPPRGSSRPWTTGFGLSCTSTPFKFSAEVSVVYEVHAHKRDNSSDTEPASHVLTCTTTCLRTGSCDRLTATSRWPSRYRAHMLFRLALAQRTLVRPSPRSIHSFISILSLSRADSVTAAFLVQRYRIHQPSDQYTPSMPCAYSAIVSPLVQRAES